MKFKAQSRHGILSLFTFPDPLSTDVLHNWEGACLYAFLLPGPIYGFRLISRSVRCLSISALSFLRYHRKIILEGSQWGPSEHNKWWAMDHGYCASYVVAEHKSTWGRSRKGGLKASVCFVYKWTLLRKSCTGRYGFGFLFCSFSPHTKWLDYLPNKWESKTPGWSIPCLKDQPYAIPASTLSDLLSKNCRVEGKTVNKAVANS